MAQSGKYQFFGRAGETFNDKNVQKKFGRSATKSGALGERILFERLRGTPKNRSQGWLPADVPLFCSLKVPGKSSDIDFAICVGDKILLIDAKMYGQKGGFYWSSGSDRTIRHNLGRYQTSSGKTIEMSQSMSMARDVISRSSIVKKNGLKVYSIVILVTNTKVKGSKQPNTMFLQFPGGVKAYNEFWGYLFMKRFLFGTRRTKRTIAGENYLKSLCQ